MALAVLAVTSCRRSDLPEKPLVVAGIPPIASIVRDIAGSRVDVMVMTDSETDPETYEPTVAQRMRMTQAQAYFMAGHLPYEKKLAETLNRENPSVRIVDTSRGVSLIKGTHMHSDGHRHDDSTDPHTWTSLRNGSIIASNICKALADIDPDGAVVYRHNLDSVLNRINYADSVVSATLAAGPVKSFVVWHPSLSYFARDYGLRQVVMERDGKESTPASIHGAITESERHGARVFFLQRQYDSRNAETVSEYLGLRVVRLNPLDEDWIGHIINVANEIANP
ncbi:MAG: zinc ABC transporter substrate-binding protein [Muribaculaceae bacterium]|nr:zinc ABC transporter substrate-binding protein [Muribaculaceae bacterium]